MRAGITKGQESPTGSDLERRGVGKQGAPAERLDDCAVSPGTLRLGDTGHEQMKRCRRAVLAFLHIPITRPLELEAIYANMEMSLQRHKQNLAMLFRHTTILVQKCKRYENRTMRNTNCEVYTFGRTNQKGCTTDKRTEDTYVSAFLRPETAVRDKHEKLKEAQRISPMCSQRDEKRRASAYWDDGAPGGMLPHPENPDILKRESIDALASLRH